ncbi:MAG: hypothetical protein LC808_43160, partial [Actinobacteria bacterium]|nr:hypothetical protein [Actinomycetota bacterium]
MAAGTWHGVVHLFRAQPAGGYQLIARSPVLSPYGVYGVRFGAGGKQIIAAAYDIGLVVLDHSLAVCSVTGPRTGYYNVSVAEAAGRVYVGLRDGRFASLRLGDDADLDCSPLISARPLCGIGTSVDGSVLVVGSFDGNVYCVTDDGQVLWTYETDGEIWSTAMSERGHFIVAGGGDQCLRYLRNTCDAAASHVLRDAERAASHSEQALGRLSARYAEKGLIEYGARKLNDIANAVGHDDHSALRLVGQFLSAHVARHPMDAEAHFLLAETLARLGAWRAALNHYQQAWDDDRFRAAGLRGAARCFLELNLNSAGEACLRRAQSPVPDPKVKRLLYDLARYYEDCNMYEQAIEQLQFIVSWDSRYRDAWAR